MSVAEKAQRLTGPLWDESDPENNRLLNLLLAALAVPYERASLYANGDPDLDIDPGQVLTDPAVSPLWALASSAQYTGGRLPPRATGETDNVYLPRARAAVVKPYGMLRGGATALTEAVRPLLTGSRYVNVVEHVDSNTFKTTLVTLTSETPDVAAIGRLIVDADIALAGEQITHLVTNSVLIDQGTRSIDASTGNIDTATLGDVT